MTTKLDRVEQDLQEMRRLGKSTLSGEELTAVMLRAGIIERWQRRGIAQALQARGIIRTEGTDVIIS